MSFEDDIRKFQQKMEAKNPRFVKAVVFQAYSMVTAKTPVKTGRAKANWFIQANSPSGEVTENTVFGGARIFEEITKITGKEPDIYISNSLPYIMALENGHSTQAPVGMTKVTVQELERYINSKNWENF